MKKYLILFLPLFFLGCEKDFDGIIEPQRSSYRVIATSSFEYFNYSESDSTIELYIHLDSATVVNQVYCEIYSSENRKITSSPLALLDNGNPLNADTVAGDNIFSNSYILSVDLPVGRYNIRYYLVDEFNKNFLAAVQSFTYDNGKDKIAPVLSDLQMSDTVNVNQAFTFSVFVSDTNGLNDIVEVYYELFRPDGSQVSNSQGISKFPLADDGENGNDSVAGDGIYTMTLTIPAGQALGAWRFEFEAKDRSNKLSNKLIHTLVVK